MAERVQQLDPTVAAGTAAAVLVLALVVGSIVAVFLRAENLIGLASSDWAAIRFTIVQATLSAVVSVGLAIPVARALARRNFTGRAFLITLMGAPFILPVIVAILGLVAVFGQNGILASALRLLGVDMPSIYGLRGVVLAHVFFNLPLATRLLLQGWREVPSERFRLAASLDMGRWAVFRAIEWPILRSVVPGAVMVVFLICLTSFAVALTLGGGPRATTIELAIYQAFRFDFELSRAATLAAVQVVLTVCVASLAFWVAVPAAFGAGLDRPTRRWDAASATSTFLDGVCIFLAALFLLAPMAMLVARGITQIPGLGIEVWLAAARSLAVAVCSAFLTMALAASLAASVVALKRRRHAAAPAFELAGNLTIAASPLVIGTGLFILVFPIADPTSLALPVTAIVNALMSLPFALRVLVPALATVDAESRRLADSLDLPRVTRMRMIYIPRLRAPIGFCLGLSAALSMGDLGVIALFADPLSPTLPLQVYGLMAAYRMEEAAGAALLLVTLSVALFWLFDRGGRINA